MVSRLVCCLGVFAAATVSLVAFVPGPQERSVVQAAVDAYPDGGVDALVLRHLTAGELIGELEKWIASGSPAQESRRRTVAAAFALDTIWSTTRTTYHLGWSIEPRGPEGRRRHLEDRSAQGVVASWASRQIHTVGPPSALERLLWLSAIGIAEDGEAWVTLHTEIVPLARRRLPDHVRVRLAAVVAEIYTDLDRLRSRSRGGIERQDLLREENLPTQVTRRIPAAILSLEALLADGSVAGEGELRIGFLELRRRHWPEALTRFDAARAKTDEPEMRAVADYFAGWVHEQLGDEEGAIIAYRRALAHDPTVRNLATRLSALLFLRHERDEAYAILDRALNAPAYPLELLGRFERGHGRFVGDWLTSVRRAIR